jgi:hypothetical protein
MGAEPKRPPNEALLSIVEQAEDDAEMDRLLAMSPEELARDLETAGYDAARIEAEKEALLKVLAPSPRGGGLGKAPPPRVRPARRAPRWAWLATAGIAVAFAAAAAVAIQHRRAWDEHPEKVQAPEAHGTAATAMRSAAAGLCAEQRWDECLAKLDEAKQIDPTGDKLPDVEALRGRAIHNGAHGTQAKPRADDKP